ncbi:MAG TPA: hypothetical protein VF670_16325 [Duganella sp.]|jgi:hypothetical protein
MKTTPLPLLVSMRLATASLLMFTATACGSAPAGPGEPTPPPAPSSAQPSSPPTAPAAAGKAEALWQKILAANADTSCDAPSQCHTIGVGSRACGGPESYLAWSSKNSDGAVLKALAEQHSAVRRADDERAQMMSTCLLVADPGASCRAGRCTVNPAARLGTGQPNLQ